jgi:hypothetical protein
MTTVPNPLHAGRGNAMAAPAGVFPPASLPADAAPAAGAAGGAAAPAEPAAASINLLVCTWNVGNKKPAALSPWIPTHGGT